MKRTKATQSVFNNVDLRRRIFHFIHRNYIKQIYKPWVLENGVKSIQTIIRKVPSMWWCTHYPYNSKSCTWSIASRICCIDDAPLVISEHTNWLSESQTIRLVNSDHIDIKSEPWYKSDEHYHILKSYKDRAKLHRKVVLEYEEYYRLHLSDLIK